MHAPVKHISMLLIIGLLNQLQLVMFWMDI